MFFKILRIEVYANDTFNYYFYSTLFIFIEFNEIQLIVYV